MAFQITPYTDLYTLNLDWVMRAVMDLQKSWAGFQVDWGKDIAAQVDAWLTAHPEATTTVLDGSIDTIKFVAGLRQLAELYVTPQKYGAAGDGVTDDTAAFNSAFNSGKKVIVPKASYQLDILLFTDDSILVLDLGTYTGYKPVCSHKISTAPLSIISRTRFSLDGTNSTWINGACMNSATGKLIVAGYHDQWIYQLNPNTGAVEISSAVSQIGDGNTVTYDSKRDKYLVTPCQTAGQVCELNNDLSLSALKTLPGMVVIPYFMAYDAERDIYYAGNSQFTYVYNGDLDTLIKTIKHDPTEWVANSYGEIRNTYSQGCDVYDGQLVYGFWLQRHFGETGYEDILAPSIGRLAINDYITDEPKAFFDVPVLANEEFEDVAVDGSDLILISAEAGYVDSSDAEHNYIVLTRVAALETFVSPNSNADVITKEAAVYQSNSYVTQADLEKTVVYRHHDYALMAVDLYVSALPESAGSILIGYTPVRPVADFQINLLGNKGTVLNLYVDYRGRIYLQNKVSGDTGTADHFYGTVTFVAR